MNENFAQMVANHLTSQDAKEDRAYVRAWVGRILVLLALLGTTIYATGAYAEPFAAATQGPVTIHLYTEPCALKDKITNLPGRATWTEGGKVFEGCAAAHPDMGVFLFYFDDKTLAIVPMQIFQKLSGA